jgi:pyridoxal 5'-phosphate synthase pdxS subunit
MTSTNGHTETNGHQNGVAKSTWATKAGLAQMLKGGVIMDVVNAEQAKIAEEAGACAVMALERVPSDIRSQGGVARMSDPDLVYGIMEAVSIPVMAKARIGHFVEAQVLESLGVDYIDESEVLTPADEQYHIEKQAFNVPFVCGARDLGEALRRLGEGAAMIRSKGEPGTGNIVEAVRHLRSITDSIRRLSVAPPEELMTMAKDLGAPYDLVREVAKNGKLPVVLFCAGGVATPADAALVMQLGAEGVFVGSGIFKSGDPARRGKAIVEAVTHFRDAKIIAEVSRGLGDAMSGLEIGKLPQESLMAPRGW